MSNAAQLVIKPLVRGAYAIQAQRIRTDNQIVANFKAKLGMKPSTKEEEASPKAKELLKELRLQHKKISESVKKVTIKNFEGEELISDFAEYALLSQSERLNNAEKENFKELEAVLSSIAIYNEFLLHVKGIGPAMAGVLISEIDIHKAKYASSIWKYAGLDVVIREKELPDGTKILIEEGRSRRKEHLVDIEYKDKNGKMAVRKGLSHNPWLKSKLNGALAPTFLQIGNKELKAGREHKYCTLYYNYKNRISNMPKHQEKTKAHINNMAIRYMVKQFLADLYENWRPIEGLIAHKPYAEAKLGINHNSPD